MPATAFAVPAPQNISIQLEKTDYTENGYLDLAGAAARLEAVDSEGTQVWKQKETMITVVRR